MYVESTLLLTAICISYGSQNCLDTCNQALGMENNYIRDSQIFGGFAYNGDYSRYGAQNARLHNSYGFRADPSVKTHSNMIGIDLDEDMVLTGIATQGYGDSSVLEWVESFNLFYKDSAGQHQGVKTTKGKLLNFPGNTDSSSLKRNEFPVPVLASSVYLLPIKVNNNIGLRLELYGCKGGHYFIVWLMLRETLFTMKYLDPSSNEHQEAVSVTINAINVFLKTTRGFLLARAQLLSPQRSPSYITRVTAIVEIHCLRSSEQHLLAKLKSTIEREDTIFEPTYLKAQYPKRCGCAPPKIDLKLSKTPGNAERIWVSKLLKKSLYVKQSCPSTENMIYDWKLSRIDEETGYFGPLQEFVGIKQLQLPLRAVGLGHVYVQCTGEIRGDDTSMAFDFGYLKVVRPPLVAKITEISYTGKTIKLSAEKSFDAERTSNSSLGLNYAWFCRLEGETFSGSSRDQVVDLTLGRNKSHSGCFGFGPGVLSCKEKVLLLNRTKMVKSNRYIFRLVISKDLRNASAVYDLRVGPKASIFIRCLSNCGKKVTVEDDLQLEVQCRGEQCSKTLKYIWNLYILRRSSKEYTVSEVQNMKINSSVDSKRVLIHDILKLHDDTIRNINYVVTVTTKLECNIVAKANFSFVVNSPPRSLMSNTGCDVRPMEGEAFSTDFFISCWGWHDEDKPLTYEFRYHSRIYGILLIKSDSLQNVSTKLPIGNPAEGYMLELEILVGDSLKAFKTTKLFVQVRPPKYSNLDDSLVDRQLNDIRDYVRAANSDRATDLAFTLMSTAKGIDDGTFHRKAEVILQEMKGVQVESVVHVTKVAAIVILATENKNEVPLRSQQSSVILLAKATNFMAVQFSSNSIHDQKLAQNISSVLLSSIGSVLDVSSHNARLNTKKVVGQEVSVSDLVDNFKDEWST